MPADGCAICVQLSVFKPAPAALNTSVRRRLNDLWTGSSSRGGWHRLNLQTSGYGVDKVADRYEPSVWNFALVERMRRTIGGFSDSHQPARVEFLYTVRIGPGYCATNESVVRSVMPSTMA
jgi:hypothetical protein